MTLSQKSVNNGTKGDFENVFLQSHNEYRKLHGVAPLKLDRKLCQFSEEWAKILASKNHVEHRKNSPYGENIYSMYSSDANATISGSAPVDGWYKEIDKYTFGKEPNNLESGHFTQVVWKTSEFLGVGVAKSRKGVIYVVANYSPTGNFRGHYTENVPPLIQSSSLLKRKDSGRKVDLDQRHVELDEFTNDSLAVHNEYRRKHGVPELKLSQKLCDYAKEWADHCLKTGKMAHRPKTIYGENIYMYSSDFGHTPSAKDVVKEWYDEIAQHKFGTESVNNNSLRFSQIVWKSSNELGIGISKNSKGETYVVANYSPRGNTVGQFCSNVPQLKL